MSELIAFLQIAVGQSPWEWLAVALGIAYVLLAAKQSKWAWPSAFVSTLIYTLLFWQEQLPMQALLNAYYLLMAVYGFWLWQQSTPTTQQINPIQGVQIHRKPLGFHLGFITIGFLLSLSIGWFLQNQAQSQLPYLDAAVTVFSVMNTFLMARKVLENWLYWIVIDSFAIVLYWHSGFYPTLLMFSLYLVLAWYGYRRWRKHLTH
ncbi:MAG: nicotinamide mononucleotide transporter [Thiotrichales bacterium]|nr:nicotinamide mononucleotide transporter [Thiotrichales bacterium]